MMNPNLISASTIKKLHPKEYIKRFLENSVRPDARSLNDFRSIAISDDGITTAEGSALVKLGSTSVICAIKTEVAIPHFSTPNEGFLVPNIELPPLCSSQFKPGPPSALAQSLSQFIANIHAKTRIIDLKRLCIDPGNAVWTLYADIYCLSYDGNVLDASLMALISALRSVRLPDTVYEDGCVRASKFKANGAPLTFLHMPLSCSFSTLDNYILADPNFDEESLQSGYFSITVDAMNLDGALLGIHKTGNFPFTIPVLQTSLDLTRTRIRSILPTLLTSPVRDS